MKTEDAKKDLHYYLSLPWSYSVRIEYERGEKIYIVCVDELLGVCAHGATFDKAMENIQEALHGVLSLYLEIGDPIPVPISEKDYKGKIAYRTTGRRHFEIAREAKRQGKSLSQTIDMLIDKSLRK